MAEYIKINNEWTAVSAIFKKISGSWVQQSSLQNALDTTAIYFYGGHSANATLSVISESQYTGKSFIMVARFGAHQVYPTWSITSGNQYATINSNGKVTIVSGTQNQQITVQAVYNGNTATKTITISYDNELAIDGSDTMTGTSGNVVARYNGTVVTPTWSITSGNQYATIDNTGAITIVASGTIVVSATYSDYTTTKTINVVYEANTQTQTEVDPDTGTTTTTTTTTTTDPQTGETTETTTQTVTNDDGSTSITETTSTTSAPDENGSTTTETTSTTNNSDGTSSSTNQTVVENEDGSSQSSTTTTNYDENGDTTGSTSNETTNNADGSSSSSTTNYNENGDPTDQQNVDTDTSGNVNTQDVEYDENGDPTVTAYTIDTTGNEAGTGEVISGDGVNTEFVPFTGTDEGFELHIRFRSVKTEQPNPPLVVDTEDTSSNYHFTILASKDPVSPWPGFHIRWTLAKNNYSSGNMYFGYKGKTGSSANRALAASKNNNVYDFTIAYDPKLKKYPSKLRCIDNLNGGATLAYNLDFDALNYDLTIGYNLNQQGQPYRYSNITVYEFSVTKL